MTPEVELLATNNFNWPSFRATVDKALKLRPDSIINKLPIQLSDDAKILLNIAAFYGHNINNPLDVLRKMPPLFMNFLSYTLMIGCDAKTWDNFHAGVDAIRTGDIIIATGTLAHWYQTITMNLSRDWDYDQNTLILFDKILLVFERKCGLAILFETYRKKLKSDGTFLLERKI
jgi:hypothetical protein